MPNGNLDINCAHCHRLEGPASNSGLFLTFGESDSLRWGPCRRRLRLCMLQCWIGAWKNRQIRCYAMGRGEQFGIE